MEFFLNDRGFVSQIVVNKEQILIDDLCVEYGEESARKLFILLLPDLLRNYGNQLKEEHLKIINKELARFGLDEVNNFEELISFVKKFDINFSYLIIQWTDYVKKTVELPYDSNFLFVSEILEHVFNLLKQQLKDYEIRIKENNNFFVLINTADIKNIRNARKLKIAIQRYSPKFKHHDIIFIPDDFLISISQKEITNFINLSSCFKYFERPNFILNTFKALGIEHASLEKMFGNYNLPIFFTDIFDIALKSY